MPDNNGLVTRYSKIVNLHGDERDPRPPTLDFSDSRASSGSRGERSYKTRADDGLNAVRGMFWGAMAGVLLWAGAFGLWRVLS